MPLHLHGDVDRPVKRNSRRDDASLNAAADDRSRQSEFARADSSQLDLIVPCDLPTSQQQVDALMLELRQGGLARTVTGAGHRVGKHKHIVDEALGLDGDELAVLAVLLLRGAQTLNQVTTRTERYERGPDGDTDALEDADAKSHSNPKPICDTHGKSNVIGDGDSQPDQDGEPNADSDSNSHKNADANADANKN